jgi:hypothetical protein
LVSGMGGRGDVGGEPGGIGSVDEPTEADPRIAIGNYYAAS